MGGVLLGLGSWWVVRRRFGALGPGFAGTGALLLLLALVAPRWLAGPRRVWMAAGETIGALVAQLVLALVYFGVVTPIGLVKRLFGWDPLERRAARQASYWRPYAERQRDPKHFEKMF